MSDPSLTPPGADRELVDIDHTVAHSARVYDYLLGGSDNFSVDREAARQQTANFPGGIEAARADIRANRAFLGRAVRHLATEEGVRQFLDIGTGIPNADNVHAVAQQTAPDARVVYVDYDPVVLAHAHTLVHSTPEGATAYIDSDLRDPENILRQAADTLDLTEPVAILLIAILHHIPDDDGPYGIVARLLEAVPAGSFLVISHLAKDIQPEDMATLARSAPPTAKYTFVMRTYAEVCRFFRGLELVAPGVVRVDQWRAPVTKPARATPIYAAVGRKRA